jgi:hypothetical protein
MDNDYINLSVHLKPWLCGVFLGLLVLAANPKPGRAQVTAAIVGRVEDASGAGVGGATITVKSLEIGTTRATTTDDTGNFRILSLPLGPQEVKAEKKGFKAVVRTGINLAVGQEAVVNLRVEIGEFIQQIAISGDVPVVNVTTASVSGVVGEREVKDLPLNGRSFDNLLTLNAGTINFSAMKSPNTSTSNGNTFSVAGRRTSENEILLNGIEYMGSSQLAITPGGVSGELLGIEAIREFNVQTDTYSAEYGKRAGAQVNVVTQSGTNLLHGSIFEFLRNSALDAPGYFDQGSTPPFKRNQFGAAAGGPLKKDRLFLFGNYEGFRQALAVSSLSIVPDQQARSGSLPNPGTGVYGQVAKLNKSMLPYMSFWPQPDPGPSAELMVPSTTQPNVMVPSGTAFSHNNPKQSIREDFGTLRTDYNIGNSDSLSGAYTIDDGNSLNPLADPLFASYTPLRLQVFSLQETHIFSPRVLNTISAGFSRASFSLTSVPLATFPASLSFVSGANPGGIVVGGGATTTANGSITSAGPNNAAGVSNHRNLFTYADTVQISKGIHQIGIGVSFQRLQDNEDSASRQLGQATFSGLTTFLQGTVTSFQVVPFHTELGWRSIFGAWYIEDTIKLRHNLTLQAGFRHEFTTSWNEAHGRAANYVTDTQGVLVTAPVLGSSVYGRNNAKRMLSPRIGLAWDPFGNGKMAIRAGYGIYYSLIDDLAFLMNSLPPYNGAATFSGSIFPPAANAIVPVTPGVLPPPSCGPSVASPCTIFAPQGVQANAKTPAVQEWDLAVEQELSRNTSLRLAYVGSFGYHELLSVDLNSIPAQICSLPACTSGGNAATKGSVSQGTQYIPVQSRPNPFLSGGFFWMTEGNSSYNALQIDVTHRFSKGLQFRGNYTWSKNLDINSGLTGAQANNQAQMVLDRNDLRRDWAPSALNATSQSSISARYELPFGSGRHWLSRANGFESKVISGWQANGIATILSGFPFTPLIGSNRSGDGDTRNPDRPSLNPSFTGPILLRTPSKWFDPSAFILPAPGTYGNLGRGALTGPGLAEVDLSVFKDTAISEKINLQFRTEIFNLLNRANFGPLNATVFSSGAISPSAGTITTLATTSRQIQFGLKLIF